VKDLFNHLLVYNLVADRLQLICDRGGAQCEILNALTHLELEIVEVTAELVRRHLLDAVPSHAHCLNRFQSICGSLLAREAGLHLL
jgi:hypothetical protein